MKNSELKSALRHTTLGGLRFYESTGSTNDEALAWATSGARDSALVVADEQSRGRGRDGRKWVTKPGASLAFSMILRPNSQEREYPGRFSGLGALALVKALGDVGLVAQIKWPNDVLVSGKKIGGILVEAVWTGAQMDSLVLGMGVNVSEGSLPADEQLNFPATWVEAETGVTVARYKLLASVLGHLADLRAYLPSVEFIQLWEEVLAFKGEKVQIWEGAAGPSNVVLVGLAGDGSLLVRKDSGELREVHFGEVHLRPGKA